MQYRTYVILKVFSFHCVKCKHNATLQNTKIILIKKSSKYFPRLVESTLLLKILRTSRKTSRGSEFYYSNAKLCEGTPCTSKGGRRRDKEKAFSICLYYNEGCRTRNYADRRFASNERAPIRILSLYYSNGRAAASS